MVAGPACYAPGPWSSTCAALAGVHGKLAHIRRDFVRIRFRSAGVRTLVESEAKPVPSLRVPHWHVAGVHGVRRGSDGAGGDGGMRRAVARVLVFLAIGAVVNVAVAWACVAW